jgi:hypothetical protein
MNVSSAVTYQSLADEYTAIPTEAQIAADFGGDASAQLAAMVFLYSRERTRQSAEQRDQLESQICAFEDKQIQKLHQAAEASYDASIWQAGGQLVGAAANVVGSGLSATGNACGAVVSAVGDMTDGACQFIAADDRRAASNLSADAEHAGNRASSFERGLESVESSADDAKAMKDAVYDFLQAVQDSKAERDKALVSIRA